MNDKQTKQLIAELNETVKTLQEENLVANARLRTWENIAFRSCELHCDLLLRKKSSRRDWVRAMSSVGTLIAISAGEDGRIAKRFKTDIHGLRIMEKAFRNYGAL